MQKKISLRVLPSEAADKTYLKHLLAQACSIPENFITGFNILRQSIDARGKTTWFQLTIDVFINEPYQPVALEPLRLNDVHHSKKQVLIIGAGPAGLFAALRLMHHGIR